MKRSLTLSGESSYPKLNNGCRHVKPLVCVGTDWIAAQQYCPDCFSMLFQQTMNGISASQHLNPNKTPLKS